MSSADPRRIATAATLLTLHAAAARAASSASFQIPASTLDVAGGTSSSASFQVTSCVGSEIAGTSSSASFTIDSGCGPALEFIAQQPAVPLAPPEKIPTLSATASMLMIVMIGAIAWRQLRRNARTATPA